jgi:gluconokinase
LQPYIIGIDIGTGSTKSIAINTEGVVTSVIKFHYPTNNRKQGFSEQDPELIWQAFVSCIKNSVQKSSQLPIGVCLSSAMHSVIPIDKNGNALAPLITWADGRSSDIAERLKASDFAEELYRNTGTPIHAMSPLTKIIWLRENNQDLFNKAYKFISIKEFIWYRLFNEFKVDISIASATGLLDIQTNEWYKSALDLAGITEEKLSTPVSPAYNKKISDASVLSLLNLSADVPVVIGASDGCLANLGSFTTNQNEAALTIGTSGAVRITGKRPIYNFSAMTFNYKLDETTFICGGAINNGGNTLQWFLKNFYNKSDLTTEDYNSFFAEVDTINSGCDGLLFLPYLNGERSPFWDTKTSGTFFGIKPHHTKAHFSRAVIEGVCYALNDVLLTIEDTVTDITGLNVSGGFVTSKTWLQILADITGKKIVVVQADDASAIGAAFYGLKTLGLKMRLNNSHLQESINTFLPNSDTHNLYNQYFDIFKNLRLVLKEPMHHLYNIGT